MRLFKELLFIHFLNSYRRFFFRKIILRIAICFFLGYSILILIEAAVLVRNSILGSGLIIRYFSISYIIIIGAVDLLLKVALNRFGVLSVYPFLRLKIPKKYIADFMIFYNHFSFINILSLFLIIPLCIILDSIIIRNQVALLAYILLLSFITNNYMSMLINISKIRFGYLGLLLVILFPVFFAAQYIIGELDNLLVYDSSILEISYSFLLLILIMVSHKILRNRLLALLYIE
jgi:hypothetical protein